MFGRKKTEMPTGETALPGRSTPMAVPAAHSVNGHPISPPFPDGMETAVFGMGCFWGAERLFWLLPGVYSTAVGYAGGFTENPDYAEVCSGMTGHTEVVLVVYDPRAITYDMLLKTFWEEHDPTQGMRQGNVLSETSTTEIYTTTPEQLEAAHATRDAVQAGLTSMGYGPITTEISPAGTFYYAEDYHQQYLAKNPNGYCGIAGTGVSCPTGING